MILRLQLSPTTFSVSVLLVLMAVLSDAFVIQRHTTSQDLCLYYSRNNDSAEQALQRTAAHLEKLKQQETMVNDDDPPDPLGVQRDKLYRQYLQQSANSLKEQLKERKLPRNGRKPDLAQRLAMDDMQTAYGEESLGKPEDVVEAEKMLLNDGELENNDTTRIIERFAGLELSEAAGRALGQANFEQPSPIQAAAIPGLVRGESMILHAETGSGKTLCYLLPITEQLWNDADGFAVILTPTRELASQVAGIASVLAPRGTVRLVSRPTNLMSNGVKERGELDQGGRLEEEDHVPRLFVGSAKSIMHSLYGDGRMPAPPTPKPLAMDFLKNVRWLVLDEVDRMLAVKKSRSDKQYKKIHEKPAAVVAAAVARFTVGRAQVVAASATVGRPLKRELARVLGLSAQDCPRVVRDDSDNVAPAPAERVHVGRAVTIPETVENYVVASVGSSDGKLLTSAYHVIKALSGKPRRMLLVLTRGFGINTQNAIGALRHFSCQPEPQSLLDALEADGTDRMIEVHRQVSGASGIGESTYFDREDETSNDAEEGYLLVTGEDTVRGLHLDGLDVVIVVGRANGPDEYTHIAGRTGRAGRTGKVINIVSTDNAAAIKSWERMLDVKFSRLDLSDVHALD